MTVGVTPHLNLEECRQLLLHVKGKRYGLAIWVQLYLGLRFGEIAALRWQDVDITTGKATIRRTFVKASGKFRECPKGGKQHIQFMPTELVERLAEAKAESTSEFVSPAPRGGVMSYWRYRRILKRYC